MKSSEKVRKDLEVEYKIFKGYSVKTKKKKVKMDNFIVPWAMTFDKQAKS